MVMAYSRSVTRSSVCRALPLSHLGPPRPSRSHPGARIWVARRLQTATTSRDAPLSGCPTPPAEGPGRGPRVLVVQADLLHDGDARAIGRLRRLGRRRENRHGTVQGAGELTYEHRMVAGGVRYLGRSTPSADEASAAAQAVRSARSFCLSSTGRCSRRVPPARSQTRRLWRRPSSRLARSRLAAPSRNPRSRPPPRRIE